MPEPLTTHDWDEPVWTHDEKDYYVCEGILAMKASVIIARIRKLQKRVRELEAKLEKP